MEKIKIDAGEWIVVCDGRKALILENRGDNKFPNLRTKEVYEHKAPSTSALGTDAPGRVHQSANIARSAVAQTDWHDAAEREFLEVLARRLDEALAREEVKKLVMVASPRALGMLRPMYSARLRRSMQKEIGKDFVKMPIHEIERQLVG